MKGKVEDSVRGEMYSKKKLKARVSQIGDMNRNVTVLREESNFNRAR